MDDESNQDGSQEPHYIAVFGEAFVGPKKWRPKNEPSRLTQRCRNRKVGRRKKWTCQSWIGTQDGWLLRFPWCCDIGDVCCLTRDGRRWTSKIDTSNWEGRATLHNQPIDLTKRALDKEARRGTRKIWLSIGGLRYTLKQMSKQQLPTNEIRSIRELSG